jgi:hypothetical protein
MSCVVAAEQDITKHLAAAANVRIANVKAILAWTGDATAEPAHARTQADVEASLLDASKNLLLESESDRPFEGFVLGATAPSAASLRAFFQLAATDPCEQLTVTDFFENRSTIVDTGLDPAVSAKRVLGLRAAIRDELTSVRVYRVGTIQVHVVIVGKTATGRWVGLQSIAIET